MEFLNNLMTIIGYLGIFWSIFKWFYDNKINFFIKVNRIFTWKKDVNFEIAINSESKVFNIAEIVDIFNNNKNIDFRIITRGTNRVVIQFDTMNVEIADSSDDSESEFNLRINFINTSSTYKSAIKKLKIINDIIEDIEKLNSINFTKIQFSSKFKNSNPFISKAIGSGDLNNIKQFMMVMGTKSINEIDDEIGTDLNIGKNNISFVDSRYSNIKLIAEVILAI